jgi:uncharacterized protein (DUF1501 family)
MSSRNYSRRGLLTGAAGGALALTTLPALSTLLSRRARADNSKPQYFIFGYFSGGWDQLLALDPRDATLPQYQQNTAYASSGSGIYPAYDLVADPDTKTLLAANPSGVQQPAGSNLSFGPAVPQSLLAHAPDLSLVRGIDMGTLTHEVGRRYFITGKFPRGLTAAGSSLPTAIVGQEGDLGQLPNLSVGVETYNETFPAFASGIQVSQAADVSRVLRPMGTALTSASDQAVQSYEAQSSSCAAQEEDSTGLVSLFRQSRKKVRDIVAAGLATHFNFTDPSKVTTATPEIQALYQKFNINTGSDLNGPLGQAALAAQAITTGVSRAVSLELAQGIDDHDEQWASMHARLLRGGFDALGQLIGYLKNTAHPAGGSYWDYTTVLCFSEFARTPLVNGRGGRDHHLASSCLVAGPGLRGNTVIGGTMDVAMSVRNIDLATGLPNDTAGVPVRPADVHATVLASMSLSDAHLSNQSPQTITALLKG